MTSSKPSFVLIRGILREQRHWGDFIDFFQQQFEDVEIITLDYPGNGQLYQQKSPSSIEKMTEGLRQQLNNKTELNLIALSMGGMIAMDWMNRYPVEIKSAVLINTSVRSYSPFFHRLRWKNYPDIFKMLFQDKLQQEQAILRLTSNVHRENSKLLKSWIQWNQQYPVSLSSAINQLLAAAKFSIDIKLHHPILIVAAIHDNLVDYRCSRKIHQLWNTDYQQHVSAGHDVPLDDPLWLAQAISRWFDSL